MQEPGNLAAIRPQYKRIPEEEFRGKVLHGIFPWHEPFVIGMPEMAPRTVWQRLEDLVDNIPEPWLGILMLGIAVAIITVSNVVIWWR